MVDYDQLLGKSVNPSLHDAAGIAYMGGVCSRDRD